MTHRETQTLAACKNLLDSIENLPIGLRSQVFEHTVKERREAERVVKLHREDVDKEIKIGINEVAPWKV